MIEFILERSRGNGYTPGELWRNEPAWPASARICYTLELANPIPVGVYKLALTVSGRAQRGTLWTPDPERRLLELVGVPGYTAIRIHAGNTIKDTEGCILVGLGQVGASLSQSRDALKAVMALFEEPATITIREK